MKKILCSILALAVMAVLAGQALATTTVNSLLDKLVEKGVITKAERRELKGHIAGDEKTIYDDAVETRLPDWVKSMKIKGDVRLRYQYEKRDSQATSRNRARFRVRLGTEFKANDQTKVMIGLAGGGTDPRSTNVTWENSSERPDLRLDYAAVEYSPIKDVKLVGGKYLFGNYFWQTTDMLIDTDINPYGLGARYDYNLLPDMGIKGFTTAGFWVVDEVNNSTSRITDPFIMFTQTGIDYKNGDMDGRLAATYFSFNGVQGHNPDNSSSSNTRQGSNLRYDYDSVVVSAQYRIKKLFGGLPFDIDDRISVFGDYVHNYDPSKLNEGWAAGFQFGSSSVRSLGQWQAKYQYVYLGKDAFVDFMPDSDRFGGATDVKSHEIITTIGLTKNVNLGLDFYSTDRIKATKNREKLFQADISVQF